MGISAARTRTQFEPSRPWVIGAVLLCAVGTLGAVAVAAAPASKVGRAPGFADVFRINPGHLRVAAAAVVAAVTVAGLAALWWSARRSWPWLLFAGAMITVPAEFMYAIARPMTFGDALWLFQGVIAAGAQLVLLGTLGAGLRLVHIGAAGAGAVLVGAGFGAQVFGAAMDVWIARPMLLQPGGGELQLESALQLLFHDGMLLAAFGAAFLVLLLYIRYDGRPELAGPSGAEPAMGRGAALAGAVAALAFVPAAVIDDGTFGQGAPVVLLATGLAASVLAGVRGVAGTVVASAVVVGISGPAGALIQAPGERIGMWFLVALGVVVGAAAVFPSWRRWTVVGGCACCGVLLAVTMAIRPDGMTVLMLFLLVATATAAIGALGVWLADDARLLVVLGPLAFAVVTGGCGLLAHWQGSGRRGPGEELFREPGHLWVYTVLLLAAAAAFAFPGRLKRGRGRTEPAPGPAMSRRGSLSSSGSPSHGDGRPSGEDLVE